MPQVQRHLQLRIEAQGKYLQSVLEKAQEALAKQSDVHLDGGGGGGGAAETKMHLSDLISRATATRRVQVQQEHLHQHQRHLGGDGSVDSCLTACEGSQCQRERERDQDQDLLSIGLSSAAPPPAPSGGYSDRGGATASTICEEFLFLDEPGRRGGGGGPSDDHDQQELNLSINGRSNPPRPRDSQRIDLNGSSWN